MKRETCKKCCWHMEWLLGEVWCTLRSKPVKEIDTCRMPQAKEKTDNKETPQ